MGKRYKKNQSGGLLSEAVSMLWGMVKGEREKSTSTPPNHSRSHSKSELFDRIDSYMNAEQPYLNENFNLEGLCRAMYSNKVYVSQAINSVKGEHFRNYVNRYRVSYAVSKMEKGEKLKMSELAQMSGFHSITTFISAFKDHTGHVPTEYQNELIVKRCLSKTEEPEQ